MWCQRESFDILMRMTMTKIIKNNNLILITLWIYILSADYNNNNILFARS